MQSFDVVIAGGGMVGLALACGLQGSGLRIAVLESQQPDLDSPLPEKPGLRVSAITPPANACSNTSAHGKTSLRSGRMPIRAWKSGIGTVSVKSRFVVRNMASAISAISLKIRLYTAHCGRKRINHLTLPCWRQQP